MVTKPIFEYIPLVLVFPSNLKITKSTNFLPSFYVLVWAENFVQLSTVLDNIIWLRRVNSVAAIQHLNQFFQQPRVPHLHAALRVLKYLTGQPALGIHLIKTQSHKLRAFCDSDWASCSHTRRSMSDYVVFLGDSLISWKSKKHQTISLSSAEAEYTSMRRIVAELAWLTRLLHELSVLSVIPVPVKCDNQGVVHITHNPMLHERTKYIELDCRCVREKLLSGLISLNHVPASQ